MGFFIRYRIDEIGWSYPDKQLIMYSWYVFQANFEKFDRDRSGKIDTNELREALMSLGFAVSPVVLDLLVSKFDKSGGKNKAIEYDNFIEYVLVTLIYLSF